jgi:hypothetical protein
MSVRSKPGRLPGGHQPARPKPTGRWAEYLRHAGPSRVDIATEAVHHSELLRSGRTCHRSWRTAFKGLGSRAKWNGAGTSRDDHRTVTLGRHLKVSCLPCHRRSLSPLGPARCSAACPPRPPSAGLLPPAHPRPAGVRQAHPGPGVGLRRPPHRRRHLLSDEPAPPPRRVDHPGAGRMAARQRWPPARAGRRSARPPPPPAWPAWPGR